MFPNQGTRNVVDALMAHSAVELTYRLFKNNATVDKNSVIGDFTESDFTGYAAKNAITEAAAASNGSDEAVSAGATLTWTCTATITAQQAFGMYVTIKNAAGTPVLLFAWKFASPTTLAFNGDAVSKKVDWYAKDYAP